MQLRQEQALKRSILKLLLLSTSLVWSSCHYGEKQKSIKLAHSLNVGHPVHLAMEMMAQRVGEKSKGKLKIEIYPSQQLGTERQCLELLQIGSLGMTKVSAGVMENFAPKMSVFGLPYLFIDKSHVFSVLDGPIGQELLLDGENYWLRGLAFYDAGSRSFYTKERPVERPEDLNGKKIRVMESITAMEMVNRLGGSPTPISAGELYTALQQGVVDGAENNPPTFYQSRQYEVCKYYSLDEHTTIPDVLLIGTPVWNRLSAEEKQWITEAAKESVHYQRELWKKSEDEALLAVKNEGVEVIYPNKTPFVEKVAQMLESSTHDKKISDLITRIQKEK